MIKIETLEDYCNEMCKTADDLEKLDLTPGTSIHEFRQTFCAAARRYRKSKENQNNGIQN